MVIAMSNKRRNIRILFVYYRLSSFVRCDLEILKRYFDVKSLHIQTFRNPLNILRLFVGVLHADLTYTWFAGTNARAYGVRSTFFVRVDVARSGKDQGVLKRLVDGGWEVGLHLINTVGDSRLPSPMSELELLQSFIGQQVYGVTPCGKTIRFKGEVTWRVMANLNLKPKLL
jgi:hypothetical protein